MSESLLFKGISSLLSKILDFAIGGRRRKEQVSFHIPKKTLTIVPLPSRNPNWWHMGSTGNVPAMQISARFFATNITKYNVVIPVAKLETTGTLGHVDVQDFDSDYWGRYALPPGGSSELHMHFWVMPPFKEKGESFTSDLLVFDQFGNKHKTKDVNFTYS